MALSGIAVPQSFEASLRNMGARVIECERFADHHRFAAQEVIDAVNRADEIGAKAVITKKPKPFDAKKMGGLVGGGAAGDK